MKTIELRIDETSRNSLKGESSFFNRIKESFKTKEQLKDYLIERYGEIPAGKTKIKIDREDGSVECVGFIHSYWNQDCSHNSKKWFQTDWISFFEQETIKTYNIKL